MSITSTHPLYDQHLHDWELMRHTYAGERVVKMQGQRYLPATPSQILDGMTPFIDIGYAPSNMGGTVYGGYVTTQTQPNTGALKNNIGFQAYESYKLRAVFHDFVSDAVESYIGLLHQKPAVFELPPQMDSLKQSATINGEGLQSLLRRINEQQLVVGRVGLLVDLPAIPDPANPLPYIAAYITEAIRNWDNSDDSQGRNVLNLVVLDESSPSRQQDYVWKVTERYRVCELFTDFVPDPNKSDEENEALYNAAPKVYKTGVFEIKDKDHVSQDEMIAPVLRGKTLEEIPFKMINTKDVIATPDNPPLIGLARLAISIYRGEADYRQSLYMQGQDTLVIVGGTLKNDAAGDGTTRVGAGAKIEVDIQGDAKYIGVDSKGLPEQRLALENDRKRAESKSGQLTAPSGQVESDKTLKTRMAAQTATLNQIAWSGAQGLEDMLKLIARWMGADESKVKVTPNLDFTDWISEGKSFDDLINSRAKGVPISLKSLHDLLIDRGLTQMTFEEEVAVILAENAQRFKDMTAIGCDFNGQPIAATVPEVRVN